MMRPVRWEIGSEELRAEVAVDVDNGTITIEQDEDTVMLSATDLEPLFAALWAAEAVARQADGEEAGNV